MRSLIWFTWGLTLWSVLQLNSVPVLSSNSVCGPWGCGPPTNALLACHLGWAVFLTPFFLITLRRTATFPKARGLVFTTLIVSGLLALLAVGIHEVVYWLPLTSPDLRQYFLHRWAFSTITLTDLPILQVIVLGIIGLLVITVKKKGKLES